MKKFNEGLSYIDIENNYYVNDDVRNIINQYIKDFDPTIRVANALKLLPTEQYNELILNINNFLKGTPDSGEIDIRTSASMKNESQNFGNGLLRIFLKLANDLCEQDTPSIEKNTSYLYLLRWKNINMDFFKPQFLKYKSLSSIGNTINFDKDYIDIYIGITSDLALNYGFICEDKSVIKIGSVKINKTIYNILEASSIFSKHFNSTFNNINFELFIKYSKVLNILNKLDFYYSSKEEYTIIDDIIVVKYSGYGTWTKSSINKDDYDELKNIIRKELNVLKFSKDIRFSLDANNYWITLKVKVK